MSESSENPASEDKTTEASPDKPKPKPNQNSFCIAYPPAAFGIPGSQERMRIAPSCRGEMPPGWPDATIRSSGRDFMPPGWHAILLPLTLSVATFVGTGITTPVQRKRPGLWQHPL